MTRSSIVVALVLLAAGAAVSAAADDGASSVVRGRAIGYAITHKYWAVYQTEAKTECPDGLNNWGPREQFKALFPQDGKKRAYIDTAMARESEVWFPHTDKEQFPFSEAEGSTAYGLNLDGRIGSDDFTSPDGEGGIDNQLYRATGCLTMYRDPQFLNQILQDYNYNRVIVELTDVDDLSNDDDVTLTTYRGLDALLTDATGAGFLPRGTQRVDARWGKEFVHHFHGKIKAGVLDTEPGDAVFPASGGWEDFTVQEFRGLRWHLKITPDSADGLIGGYADVNRFYRQINETISTHHLSYGQLSSPSLYRALKRLADGYPDPKTGEFTAISAAMHIKMKQVFVKHPLQENAAGGSERNAAEAGTQKVASAAK